MKKTGYETMIREQADTISIMGNRIDELSTALAKANERTFAACQRVERSIRIYTMLVTRIYQKEGEAAYKAVVEAAKKIG